MNCIKVDFKAFQMPSENHMENHDLYHTHTHNSKFYGVFI